MNVLIGEKETDEDKLAETIMQEYAAYGWQRARSLAKRLLREGWTFGKKDDLASVATRTEIEPLMPRDHVSDHVVPGSLRINDEPLSTFDREEVEAGEDPGIEARVNAKRNHAEARAEVGLPPVDSTGETRRQMTKPTPPPLRVEERGTKFPGVPVLGQEARARIADKFLPPFPLPEGYPSDGWKPWTGGPRPVGWHDYVNICLRDGSFLGDNAGRFEWRLDDMRPDKDIIAYRVEPDEPKLPLPKNPPRPPKDLDFA